MPDLRLEDAARRRGHAVVCGVDEAGRGPWAGPVVAAAVNLAGMAADAGIPAALDDSKKLSKKVREELHAYLSARADVAVGVATAGEIDALNILQATMLAMRRAVEGLRVRPGLALVDGNRPPDLGCAVETVVGGDGVSASIAAASVVAKVTRDRMMGDLAADHPGYGWERNAGYGTAEHKAALARLGVTAHHRTSFRPVRDAMAAAGSLSAPSGTD